MTLDQWRLASGLTVAGLGYLAQHWFPWPRKLRRLEAYAIGTLTLWIGMAIWRAPSREFWLSCAFPLVAGLAVGGAYAYDAIRNLIVRAHLNENEHGDAAS